ncbi:CAAX protease self-immunity [uncultured archaeon]|nr:CAAX protease self-immunity [uncultured archaeon]
MKPQHLLALFFLAAAALILFPIGDRNSSVFYVSLSFFLFALLVSSSGTSFKNGLSQLGLLPDRKKLPSLLLWGIGAFFVSVAVAFCTSAVLYALGMLDTAPVQAKIVQLPPLAILIAVTLAPLGEEALFRGLAFARFKGIISRKNKKMNNAFATVALAAVFSSIIFAALHFSYGSAAEIIAAFMIGLVFCAFTQKTGSLVPALVGHALFNLLSISATLVCASGACPF